VRWGGGGYVDFLRKQPESWWEGVEDSGGGKILKEQG